VKSLLRLAFVSLLLSASPAVADGPWPQKPVRVIVPFPGGGPTDVLCRAVSEKLAAAWNQQVIVVDSPGDNGNIGAEVAFNAPSDGYTLLCSGPGSLAMNQNLYKSLTYDPLKFAPIIVLSDAPSVIAIRRDLPANSFRETIDYAKANPGKVSYASSGTGSAPQLSALLFATLAGVTLVHAPTRSETAALVDLSAGRADIFIGSLTAALRFEKSKEIRFVGLASKTRSPVAPQVPSAFEVGMPGLTIGAWVALAAPPGTPDAILQKINADAAAALKQEDVRTKLLAQGAEPVGQSIAATTIFIRQEEARWSAVIKAANVEPQ
jgi:tripartite-type tricarboxylate transporter receptor subunit TctC